MGSRLGVKWVFAGSLAGVLTWALLLPTLRTNLVVAQGDGWSEPLNIANTPGNSRYQEIAADAWGNVHVVWSEDEDGKGWGESIYYTMWNGETWSKPVDIFYTPPMAHIPAIAADRQGYVHVVWHANNTTRYSRARIADGPWSAVAWSEPQVLSTQSTYTTYWTDIAVDGYNNIHTVWEERHPGEEAELYYRRSTDAGRSWLSLINLSNSPADSSWMQIAVNGRSDVHVVWVEQTHAIGGGIGDIGVFYSRSTDEGNSWSDPTNISGEEAGLPTIVARGANEIHVIWTKYDRGSGHNDLYHRMWDGKQWSAPHLIIDGAGRGVVWPRAAVDGAGNIHLVWTANAEKGGAVYYSWSSDGGQSWSAPVDISQQAPVSVWRADIAVSEGNRLHVVWHGGGDIYYATHQTEAPWETPLPPMTSTPAKSTPSAAATATVPPSPTVVTSTQNPVGVQRGVLQSSWFPLVAAIVPVVGLMALVVVVRIRSQRSSW